MINLIISLIDFPSIRYSLYEQIYDKFYKPNEKFSFSVSNYLYIMNFGSLFYNFDKKFGIYLNYLNSGKMYRTDEYGNVIGEFYSNFINFSVYKSFLKFNVHYQSLIENKNELNLSIGANYSKSYKNLNVILMFDYLGLNTPLITGFNLNYEAFNFGLSYELGFGIVYNISYKYQISNFLNLYICYTNRYNNFKSNNDFLTGFLGGLDVNVKNYRIGFGIRPISNYGYITTIQMVYKL